MVELKAILDKLSSGSDKNSLDKYFNVLLLKAAFILTECDYDFSLIFELLYKINKTYAEQYFSCYTTKKTISEETIAEIEKFKEEIDKQTKDLLQKNELHAFKNHIEKGKNDKKASDKESNNTKEPKDVTSNSNSLKIRDTSERRDSNEIILPHRISTKHSINFN